MFLSLEKCLISVIQVKVLLSVYLKAVLRYSMVKCTARNHETPGSSRGSILWQEISEPQPSTGENREIHEYRSCRHDMTEMIFKVAKKKNKSTNPPIN